MRHTRQEAAPVTGGGEPGLGGSPARSDTMGSPRRIHSHGGFLDGQMLVAMPGMVDGNFARSVVYLCAHSEEGAMGIIINRAANRVSFPELLVQLDIIKEDQAIGLPGKAGAIPVLKGGPVETGRGFVLHSADFFVENSTLTIDGQVSLTATVDILRAIADGSGPSDAVLALGYAGWQAGQLEAEMQNNGWLNVPADASLIFDPALESKYERAVRNLGFDVSRLSPVAGRA